MRLSLSITINSFELFVFVFISWNLDEKNSFIVSLFSINEQLKLDLFLFVRTSLNSDSNSSNLMTRFSFVCRCFAVTLPAVYFNEKIFLVNSGSSVGLQKSSFEWRMLWCMNWTFKHIQMNQKFAIWNMSMASSYENSFTFAHNFCFF